MAKYNIYKLKENRVVQIENLLSGKGYALVNQKDSDGYNIRYYFTPEPDTTDIWWLEQYQTSFGEYSNRKNLIFSGAALVAGKEGHGDYLIALGKTHFYIQQHIEIGFGLDLAERIANSATAKTKSTKKFAGKTSKAITSYMIDSDLSFVSGEAADYVKLKPVDEDVWGKSFIHFGTSAQFSSLDVDPENLHYLFLQIDEVLSATNNEIVVLPRMLAVKDSSQIAELDMQLAKSIRGESADGIAGIYDYELYGTNFIFSQATQVRIRYKSEDGYVDGDILDELSLDSVKTFCEVNNLDLNVVLRELKVQVLVDSKSKFTTDLIKLIDYLGTDKIFLYRGKWYFFNKSFIEQLQESVDLINMNVSEHTFDNNSYKEWLKNHAAETVKYPEKYIIDTLVENDTDWLVTDRELEYWHVSGKTLSLEVSDIYKPESNELVVVKRGKPKDFSYAANQALATLTQLDNGKFTYENGAEINVDSLTLYLITTNATIPEKVRDIESLNFLIQLNELQILASEKGVSLNITFAGYTN